MSTAAARRGRLLPGDKETRKALEELGIDEGELYDESPTLDDLYDIPLVDGLTPVEIAEANIWRRFYYGVMLAIGKPGSGKGLWLAVLGHKMKRFFGRRILLDYKPREPFGLYMPFNEQVLVGELGKMREVAATAVPKEVKRGDALKVGEIRTLAQKWMSTKGEVFLRGVLMGLDELKRYFHNRRPHNPMGITLGHVVTIHRHLDMLLVGSAPFKRELDAISFLPYVTHEVRCSWGIDGKAHYKIYQTVWISSRWGGGQLDVKGKPFIMTIDGAKPRDELGGLCYYDLYNSKDPKALRPSQSITRYHG